ncbi:class I SAM-dependent methyltransferase, partial [Alphaproteobacteria bacterium]|nr:class I SAM-dependent methyltransferase [Alphaproteobacteria bacterium]
MKHHESWDDRYKTNPKYRNIFPFSSIVSILARLKKSKRQRILELGCGSGCNLWAANQFGFDCYGIDISPTIVAFAKQFLEEKQVKADLRVMKFEQIHKFDIDFDLIIDRSSIHCTSLDLHKDILC